MLALAETLAKKRARLSKLEALVLDNTASLTGALAAFSIPVPIAASLPHLMGLAQRALTTAATAQEKRQGTERALGKLRNDLTDRTIRRDKARRDHVARDDV